MRGRSARWGTPSAKSRTFERRMLGSSKSWPRRFSKTVYSRNRAGLRFARGRGVRVDLTPCSLTIIATLEEFNDMDSVEVSRWQRDGFEVCG